MRFGVSSYSFDQLLRKSEMNEFDIIQEASKIGFEFIEFAGINPKDENRLEYAKKLKEAAKENKIEIVNYAISADFINKDAETEIERVKKEVEVAKALGVKYMRHDATVGKRGLTYKKALPILANACRQISQYAKGFGIKTMVENHGFFVQGSKRLEALFEEVDYENFGLLVDMGNFMCVDEPSNKAVGRLIDYAFLIHAKDFHVKSAQNIYPGPNWIKTTGGNYLRGAIILNGNLPLLSVFKILNQNGYDGDITLEFEGLEDCKIGIERSYENLIKLEKVAKK